jgi:sterol desaturase/sphingolipid hydroxylase (fatty acid hydroxylase superfamily)
MVTSAIALGAMAVSIAVWTFAEYALHRWAFHRRVPRWWKTPIAHEHLVHHAEPNTTSPVKRATAWLAIVALGAVMTVLLVAIGVPYLVALGALAGWVIGYSGYEVIHWRTHHRRLRSPYEQRVRLRHFDHHFGQVSANFGVTIEFWDHVFGTFRAPTLVTIPRRHAPVWILREPDRSSHGSVGLALGPERSDSSNDRSRAFSNEPPE